MISRLPRWVWFGGSVLAFTAGIVNAVAFLSFVHQAATHVTGIFTHLSLDVYHDRPDAAAQSGFALLFFFSGAALGGFVVRDAHLKMGRRYGLALLVECLLLIGSTLAFQQKSVRGEYLACMAAGLQNAMVSMYSGTIVRTTHMTGVLTDLGALFGQMIAGVRVDHRKTRLLLGILTGFFLGGLIGAYAYSRIQYLTMLIPAAITGTAALFYFAMREWTLRSRQAASG